jgi:hypothetical protein
MKRLQKREAVLPDYGDDPQCSILGVCQDIHSAVSGSSDAMPDDELRMLARFLQVCLETWEDTTHPQSVAFDRAVKQLVHTTLCEVGARCPGLRW